MAKLGVAGVGSDFATILRALVMPPVLALFLSLTHGWQPLSGVSPRTGLFLVLSGLATGASWLCCFRALKLGDGARVDKLSVVLVALIGALALGERLAAINWQGVALIALGASLVSWR